MAVQADSVVVDLEAKIDGYKAEMTSAVTAHKGAMSEIISSSQAAEVAVTRAATKKGEAERAAAASAQNAAGETGRAAGASASATEAATRRVVAAKADEVRAVKASADDQVSIEAAKQARITAAVERGLAAQRTAIARGTGVFNTSGYDVKPGEQSVAALPVSAATQAEVAAGATAATERAHEEAAAETEVNYLLRDRILLQTSTAAASGEEKNALRDQLTYLNLIDRLQRAGLSTTEATALAEKQLAIITAERAATESRITTKEAVHGAERFAEGFGIRRTGGSIAAIGGILAAGAVGLTAEAVKTASDYAAALTDVSNQLGITTTNMQAYRAMAEEVGVKDDQLATGLHSLADNLGKAKDGGAEQIKIFKALGIEYHAFTNAGDLLPTLADRLSQISDQSQRLAIETQLGGAQLAKLDPILSQGAAALNNYAAGLEASGKMLTPEQVKKLDDLATGLKNVREEMAGDLRRAVADDAGEFLDLAQSVGQLVDMLARANKAIGDFFTTTAAGMGMRIAFDNMFGIPLPGGPNSSGGSGGGVTADIQDVGHVSDATARRFGVDPKKLKPPPWVIPHVHTGNVNAGLISQLNAPHGRHPKGKDEAKLQAERDKTFTDELNRANDAILASKRQETGDADVQRELDRQRIAIDLKRQLTDVDLQVKEHKIDASKAEELKNQLRAEAEEKNRVLAIQKQSQAIQTATALANDALSAQADILHAQESLASTAKERGIIEQKLLANAKLQEENSLRSTLADPLASSDAKSRAAGQLGTIDQRYDAQAEVIKRNNENPMDAYLRTLKPSADQINEALQSIEANGLKSLSDGITDAIVNGKNLGEVFHNVANQIIADLLRIAIQKFVIGTLLSLIPGGGIAKSATSAGTGALKGFAGGGRPPVGVPSIVGEDGPEIFMPDQAGTIIPNNSVARSASGGGGQPIVRIEVAPGQLFEPVVRSISGNVAIQTVAAAAPQLTSLAVNETTRTLSRPRL